MPSNRSQQALPILHADRHKIGTLLAIIVIAEP